MTTVSASVVICAYTMARWTLLQQAIESVLGQDPRAQEIIVVVDHCPELERLVDATYQRRVRVVENSSSRGLSGARNSGVSVAHGDLVVFLDDDAHAQRGWLAGHLTGYDDPDVAGVGGRVVAAWEDPPPHWFPPEFGWVVGCSYVGQPTTAAQIRNPIGANMSFRRAMIDAVGGFSDQLGRVGTSPVGCEETELSIRMARRFPAARIMYSPTAVVHHHVTRARSTWGYFRRRCWSEGLSKARLARMSDPRTALQSERAYVVRTLPRGVRRDTRRAVETLDLGSLHRAFAILFGLAVTTAGFLVGRSQLSSRTNTHGGMQ
jgi:glycosyltransferase involved in cell wall biosynthesis